VFVNAWARGAADISDMIIISLISAAPRAQALIICGILIEIV